MAATYEPIATTTLGSAASSITFSSIPNTYTDLRLVLVGTNTSNDVSYGRFNSDTAGNYSTTILYGSGASVASTRTTNDTAGMQLNYYGGGQNQPLIIDWNIFSYAGSTNKTSLSSLSNDLNGSGLLERSVHLWRSTSAITTVQIRMATGSYSTGTTATLYGILKA